MLCRVLAVFSLLIGGLLSASLNGEYGELVRLVERLDTVPKSWEYNSDHELTLNVKKSFLFFGACDIKSHKKGVKKNVGESAIQNEEEDFELPESFDSREEWSNCKSISHIRDQSQCGSCWAFGSSEAMSDRICVASNGTKSVEISAAHVTACAGGDRDGCTGNTVEAPYEYYSSDGLVSGGDYKSKEGCWPYPFPACAHHMNGSHNPPCPHNGYKGPKCVSECPNKNYKIPFNKDLHFGGDLITPQGEEEIQREIYKNGPVTAGFDVYADFFTYKSGVYHHVDEEPVGGHAIRILGWGVENNQKYWLCANSWNDEWGDGGFFKILRGTNECGIEDAVIASLPHLD